MNSENSRISETISAILADREADTLAAWLNEIEKADQEHAQQVRARRLECYQQMWELHQAGWQRTAIAHQLGIGERTVYRYLKSPAFPERRERKDRGQSLLVLLQKVIGLEPIERKSKVLWLIPKLRLSGGIFSRISSC